jgi:hypothetical protein
MNADGGSPGALTSGGGSEPSWSPDGARIAFTRGGEVWAMNAGGGSPGALTSGGGSEPDWGIGGAPENTSPPTISGSASQGGTLTAARGTWKSSSPLTYAYQWRRCDASGAGCTAISGATGGSYTLAAGDVGATIRVAVTATNADGSATAESLATVVVAASGGPVNTAPPTITGTASVGSVLASSEGTWTGTGITYTRQWQRCDASGGACTAISGATGTHYLVAVADVGRRIRVAVTATNASGSAMQTSAATGVVAAAPTTAPSNTVAPSISGTPRVGALISAFRGTWSGTGINYTQQWQRCDASGANCSNISGATSLSYTPTASDLGSRLLIVVTASNSAGSASAPSLPSAAVTAATTTTTGTTSSTLPRNVTRPRITGTPVQGSTLTANAGSWTGSGLTFTYQWERCDDEDEDECEEIAGATRSTYTLASRDVGSRLRVQVTARNSAGEETETSDTTEVVRAGGATTVGTGSTSPTTGRTLRGTARADVILGTAGSDTIQPGRGADTVVAGEGDDVIDSVDGARDVVVCGAGRDRVTADRIDVLRECETVRYAPGGKTLRGTSRADILIGGDGNDTILPGAGADTVIAGGGDDVVVSVDGSRDVVACGEGRDRVTADRVDTLRGCDVVRRVAPKEAKPRRR